MSRCQNHLNLKKPQYKYDTNRHTKTPQREATHRGNTYTGWLHTRGTATTHQVWEVWVPRALRIALPWGSSRPARNNSPRHRPRNHWDLRFPKQKKHIKTHAWAHTWISAVSHSSCLKKHHVLIRNRGHGRSSWSNCWPWKSTRGHGRHVARCTDSKSETQLCRSPRAKW